MIGVLGDPITVTCTVELSFNLSGCTIEYDYGFITNTSVTAGAGVKLYHSATISPVNISSAGEYTCTATVFSGQFCQVNGSRTSDAVILRVQRA